MGVSSSALVRNSRSFTNPVNESDEVALTALLKGCSREVNRSGASLHRDHELIGRASLAKDTTAEIRDMSYILKLLPEAARLFCGPQQSQFEDLIPYMIDRKMLMLDTLWEVETVDRMFAACSESYDEVTESAEYIAILPSELIEKILQLRAKRGILVFFLRLVWIDINDVRRQRFDVDGHENVLILDTRCKVPICARFEPHGNTREDPTDKGRAYMFDSAVRDAMIRYVPDVRYYSNCGTEDPIGIQKKVQSNVTFAQNLSDFKVSNPFDGGLCSSFAMYMAHIALLNPTRSPRELWNYLDKLPVDMLSEGIFKYSALLNFILGRRKMRKNSSVVERRGYVPTKLMPYLNMAALIATDK